MPEHLETSAAWALRACGLRCAFCRSILCSSCRAGVQSAGSERRLSLCLSLDTQSTWHLRSVSRIHGAFWAVGKCLHVISSVPGRFTYQCLVPLPLSLLSSTLFRRYQNEPSVSSNLATHKEHLCDWMVGAAGLANPFRMLVVPRMLRPSKMCHCGAGLTRPSWAPSSESTDPSRPVRPKRASISSWWLCTQATLSGRCSSSSTCTTRGAAPATWRPFRCAFLWFELPSLALC